MIRGLIFDLDGTLVDSQLDFDAMRREMELPPQLPILEALATLEPAHAERCQRILLAHEIAGAERATLLPGVAELFEVLDARGLRRAIATRNSRRITEITLAKLDISSELVFTRDDGPVKPDPWPVLHACDIWGIAPSEAVVIGDFRFDIECGRAAGSRTVILVHPQDPRIYENEERADLVLRSLADYSELLTWIRRFE
jgi:HAD superfamily hydrolase (TIGR01549 family)